MGAAFGARLFEAGHAVTLVDLSKEAVDAINAKGLCIEVKTGERRVNRVPATTLAAEVGPVDLVVNFVKCYHTEAAIRSVLPILRPDSAVLSLQNGWGNAPVIAGIVGDARVLMGVTYHSATVLGPGHVLHAGEGPTFLGPLTGEPARAKPVAEALMVAGLDVTVSENILTEIWSKVLLNVCTLPTSALLRFGAVQLVEHEGTMALMRALLEEGAKVVKAQGLPIDEEERWATITGLLGRIGMSKPSMLQDVENGRRTEIDVINGAIVAAGKSYGIPTPHNETMVWLVKALEDALAKEPRS